MLPDNPLELRKMDKEDIIKGLLEGVTYSVPDLVKDKFGNNESQLDESYDAYTGGLVGKGLVKWTYHDAKVGNVKSITVDDGIGQKKRTVSEYSLDPTEQPAVSRFIVAETVPLPEKVLEGIGGGVTGAVSGTKNLLIKVKDTITGLLFRA